MIKKFLKRWRRVGDRWQNLHGFFQVSGARFFIAWFALTPAVAKILEEIPDPLFLTVQNNTFLIHFSLPFNWTVLWFASFFYAIGFIWFHFRCPKFIKNNPNFMTYLTYGHSPRWLVNETEMAWSELPKRLKDDLAQRLVEKGFAQETERPNSAISSSDNTEREILKDHTEWSFQYSNQWYKIAVSETENDLKVRDLFWEIFGRHSEDRVFSRYFVWVLSTIACLLTFLVVCQNILFVFRYLFA